VLRSLLRLRRYVAAYRLRLGAGIVAFGIARVFEALVPLFLARGIDRLAAGDGDLTLPVLGIFGAVIARYLVVTFARYSVRSAGLHLAFDLRRALFEALQSQGSAFFNRYSIGDMMTRAVADISLVQRLISMGTILLVILVYATLVGFGFMLYLSPGLTLLLLPPLPLVFFYARWSSQQMAVASQEVQDRLSELGTHVQENLSGIRTIQAMVQEDNEVRRFAATNQRYASAFYRQARVNSLMAAWMPSLAAVCSITILGYGGKLVLDGAMTVGELVAFFMYVSMVVQPFRVAGFMINLFQRAAVACDRLFEVLDRPPEIDDSPSGRTPAHIAGHIELRGLSYHYPGSTARVLDRIDLDVAEGEFVAVMGRVGAGKSTLLKALLRLLDSEPGAVLIDGHPIADYPLAQLRRELVLVPQEPFLFAEPLRDNLTYDDPQRDDAEIWQAAEAADLAATIRALPDGLDTLVGERGVTLSGGQKQRAALARGLIRSSPVLLLDDCFSSVDTGTEEHILRALRRLRAGRTTVLVSHRVSTVRHADRIVVLEAGRIVELGSHEQLLARGGAYAELERIQREGASEADFPVPELAS